MSPNRPVSDIGDSGKSKSELGRMRELCWPGFTGEIHTYRQENPRQSPGASTGILSEKGWRPLGALSCHNHYCYIYNMDLEKIKEASREDIRLLLYSSYRVTQPRKTLYHKFFEGCLNFTEIDLIN